MSSKKSALNPIAKAKDAKDEGAPAPRAGIAHAGVTAFVHESAIVERSVTLGEGTAVWDNAHIRHGARLGRNCIVGEKSYIAYDVSVGDHVKLNACVYICAGVTIEDHVMVSAHVAFTNDRFPRAFPPDLSGLQTSAPTSDTLATIVRRGATIGANATIGPGVEIGAFAMVGMGAVVTKSVKPHQLVFGCPAAAAGWVCVCGPPITREPELGDGREVACASCGRRYVGYAGVVAHVPGTGPAVETARLEGRA